ncbi:MAG: RnfABCDGE type electron transport complex subunit G [Oscillospiraceae bacterium]|nr:RnfABCDGE type electron transport complex subunit G [Oscillospiraceae bacterium]
MAAKQGSGAYIAKLAITLLGICVVCAGLLGLVNAVTKDTIAQTAYNNQQAALAKALPDATFEQVELADSQASYDIEGVTVPILAAYIGKDASGNVMGCVIETGATGFAGVVDMVTGIKADGSVNAISIISSTETSGLGQNASKDWFREQMVGASSPDVKVTKDGGTVNALTGATITSRCVTRSVNASLTLAQELLG